MHILHTNTDRNWLQPCSISDWIYVFLWSILHYCMLWIWSSFFACFLFIIHIICNLTSVICTVFFFNFYSRVASIFVLCFFFKGDFHRFIPMLLKKKWKQMYLFSRKLLDVTMCEDTIYEKSPWQETWQAGILVTFSMHLLHGIYPSSHWLAWLAPAIITMAMQVSSQ